MKGVCQWRGASRGVSLKKVCVNVKGVCQGIGVDRSLSKKGVCQWLGSVLVDYERCVSNCERCVSVAWGFDYEKVCVSGVGFLGSVGNTNT